MQTKKKEYSPKNNLIKLYNLEAEKSILGCVLFANGNELMLDEIFNLIKIEDFNEVNQIIYQAMMSLYRKAVNIDLVTLCEVLERNGQYDKVGGISYITELAKFMPSAANYKHYLSIILDYSKLRKYGNLGYYLSNAVYDGVKADVVKTELNKQLEEIDKERTTGKVEHISVSMEQEQERINKILCGDYDDFGLSTGFKVLDKTLWGLQKSDLIIVGARAGVGKTAFAVNILNHIANVLKKKCLFFSLEMPKNQIIKRFLSCMTGIDNYEIKKVKTLTPDDIDKIKQAKQQILNGNLYIDDTSNNTIQEMSLKAKYLQRKEGLDLIVVDYLQFVRPGTKSGNRFQDVGEIARDLKVMARQLNVPVIALCQLNRQLDTETRAPELADLRESGEIEMNADIVMFLHGKEGKYNEIRKIDLIIGKFRNGQMRIIRMEYQGNIFKFREVEDGKKPMPVKDLKEINDPDLPF